jgi:urease accessory protein
MGWHGHLQLHYTRDGERCIAHDRHEGPLRVMQRLYPEGPSVCHQVLVHPPGGVVGGDVLQLDVRLDEATHALITTPGATRFYRSAGPLALQTVTLHVARGARLEWLPLEAIAYAGCEAENRVHIELEPGAEMMGWDLLALGLPAAGQAFERGRFRQHLQWPGVWLERGLIDATDRLLLDSPLGLAGERTLGTIWFACGTPMSAPRREALLDAAREAAAASPLARLAGASAPDERLVVMRLLAPRVEPAMRLLTAVWERWRRMAWEIEPCPPRVWRT